MEYMVYNSRTPMEQEGSNVEQW
jgi:hypothetical protein